MSALERQPLTSFFDEEAQPSIDKSEFEKEKEKPNAPMAGWIVKLRGLAIVGCALALVTSVAWFFGGLDQAHAVHKLTGMVDFSDASIKNCKYKVTSFKCPVTGKTEITCSPRNAAGQADTSGHPGSKAIVQYDDGFFAVGEMKDDMLEGQGTLTWPNGVTYAGHFEDNLLNGEGTVTDKGQVMKGTFRDGKFTPAQNTPAQSGEAQAAGQGKAQPKSGTHSYTWPTGDMYHGEWKDFKQDGQGTYTAAGGLKYVGHFDNGQMNGQGTMTWPDGNISYKYVGEYRNGVMNGKGTLAAAGGLKYVGHFDNGQMNGQGTMTWHDGNKYVGEVRNGQMNGKGTMIYKNGQKVKGVWKDGKKVKGD